MPTNSFDAVGSGGPAPDDAHWPLMWPDATGPVPLRPATDVVVAQPGEPRWSVSVLRYDTPHSVVAYVLRHPDPVAPSFEAAAEAAARALTPAERESAIVLVAYSRSIGSDTEPDDFQVYRLRPVPARASAPATGRAEVRAHHTGSVSPAEVARVLGRPLPLWLDRTCTPAAVRQVLAHGDATMITATETITDWTAIRDALPAVAELGIPQRYPHAYALLAEYAVDELSWQQEQLADTPRAGHGWYLATLPAAPHWPIALEHQITTAANRPFDADDAAAELPALRAEEADLLMDHPAGEALLTTAVMLAVKLLDSHPEVAQPVQHRSAWTVTDPTESPSGGPVTSQYLAGLTRLSDEQTRDLLARPTRRIVHLLMREELAVDWRHSAATREGFTRDAGQVTALYRAPDGRYTAAVQPDHNLAAELAIEWPATLPAGWNDDTRIAADEPAGVVVALTPQPDGELLIDLLPNPGGELHYGWGDEGPGPRALYQALMRCATGNWQHPLTDGAWMSHLAEHPDSSALYQAITTQRRQLLLRWADIRRQADEDLATLQYGQAPVELGGAGMPTWAYGAGLRSGPA